LKNDVPYFLNDIAGRQCLQGITSAGNVSIPENLARGTYFVSIEIKEKVIVKKLMITP
jgi:hypothetical protein